MSIAALCLQMTLVYLLVRRRIYHRFPLFFAYSMYSILASAVQMWAMSRSFFFSLYRITEIGDGLLALMVIREVMRSGVEERHSPRRWVNILPPLIALVILGDSLWQASMHPMGHTNEARFAAGFYSFERDVLCLEIVALVFALRVDWRRRDPIRWGRYRFAIIAGFGGAALITLMAQLLRTYFGAAYEEVFRYLPSGAFFGQTLFWLSRFAGKEPPKASIMSEAQNRTGGESDSPQNISPLVFIENF